MAIKEAAIKILDGLAKKQINDVEDEAVRKYLSDAWGGVEKELPDLIDSIVGQGEVILAGENLAETKKILAKMGEDLTAFHSGQIDEIEYEDLVWRRKAALFALYNAQKITAKRPSIQKILMAIGRLAEILVTKGIPFILAAI